MDRVRIHREHCARAICEVRIASFHGDADKQNRHKVVARLAGRPEQVVSPIGLPPQLHEGKEPAEELGTRKE